MCHGNTARDMFVCQDMAVPYMYRSNFLFLSWNEYPQERRGEDNSRGRKFICLLRWEGGGECLCTSRVINQVTWVQPIQKNLFFGRRRGGKRKGRSFHFSQLPTKPPPPKTISWVRGDRGAGKSKCKKDGREKGDWLHSENKHWQVPSFHMAIRIRTIKWYFQTW